MTIGQLIKNFREKNHLTQAEFGKAVGVNKQTISKWENGIAQPSTRKLFEITQITGIELREIIEENNQSNIKELLNYAPRSQYKVGLNSMYSYVHDYKTFCMFYNLFASAFHLLNTNSESIMGYLLYMRINIEDPDGMSLIYSTYEQDKSYILINISDGTLIIEKEAIFSIEPCTLSNNEAYVFNIFFDFDSLGTKDEHYIQLFLCFHNDDLERSTYERL